MERLEFIGDGSFGKLPHISPSSWSSVLVVYSICHEYEDSTYPPFLGKPSFKKISHKTPLADRKWGGWRVGSTPSILTVDFPFLMTFLMRVCLVLSLSAQVSEGNCFFQGHHV